MKKRQKQPDTTNSSAAAAHYSLNSELTRELTCGSAHGKSRLRHFHTAATLISWTQGVRLFAQVLLVQLNQVVFGSGSIFDFFERGPLKVANYRYAFPFRSEMQLVLSCSSRSSRRSGSRFASPSEAHISTAWRGGSECHNALIYDY